jgi:hypothetical protein
MASIDGSESMPKADDVAGKNPTTCIGAERPMSEMAPDSVVRRCWLDVRLRESGYRWAIYEYIP